MAKVTMYSTNVCPYCVAAKNLFQTLNVSVEEIKLDTNFELREKLSKENGGWRTVPMIFVGDKFIGGFDDVKALHAKNELLSLVNAP